MGFDIAELCNGSFGQHRIDEGFAFFQSWLFFGLLRKALAEHSEVILKRWVQDYESTIIDQKYMMKPHLARYLDLCFRDARIGTEESAEMEIISVATALVSLAQRCYLPHCKICQ